MYILYIIYYMKKVITFSLWGNIPKYTVGAIKNAELANIFYPDFEYWFYIHKDTVDKEIIEKIQKIKNTKIIMKEGNLLTSKPMCWRFEAIDDPDVEVMMPRDTDTRILLREKLAVDEWLNSDKLIHIMRDHYKYHTHKIFGGMFGTKKIPIITSWIDILNNFSQKNMKKHYDLHFLNIIMSKINNNNIMIHSPYKLFPNENIKNFPIPYDEKYLFVGCYVYEDESLYQEHHDLLIKKYKKK